MPSAASVDDPAELNLLRQWREPLSPARILRAGTGSILFHVVVVTGAIWLAGIPPSPQAPPPVNLRQAVHLIAPRILEPTQKAPNQGKVTHELDVRSAIAAPRRPVPRFTPPAPPPGLPQAAINLPPAAPPSIEPPKIDVPAAAPPPVAGNGLPAPPPPAKPKLAFESVAAQTRAPPNPQIQPPKTSVEDAMRSAIQAGGGGTIVGDTGDDLIPLPRFNQNEAPGRIGSNLQLLSDPKGVDFKPYLIQVLAAVRRNWLAIIPESARMGRRGRVLVQFIVDRRGGVPKLVIAEASGTEAFDRAAVAGISASYPFPPLPSEYLGDQIRLQLAFSYNVPTR